MIHITFEINKKHTHTHNSHIKFMRKLKIPDFFQVVIVLFSFSYKESLIISSTKDRLHDTTFL